MAKSSRNKATRYLPALAIVLVGAILMGAGIWRGEPLIVEKKAVRICAECIGIG